MSQRQSRSKFIKTLIVDDDDFARKRLKRLLSAFENIQVVGEAENGIDAQQKILALKPQLVFMDIEMPFLNGVEVARSLGVSRPMIIFVTAFDAYAVRAFEVNATDYLLKPVQTDRLAISMDKVTGLLERGAPYPYEQFLASSDSYRENRRISFVDGKDILIVNMDCISIITTEDRYSHVYCENKDVLIDESLNQLITRLDKRIFLFAHRNAIVNIRFVDQLKRQGLRKYALLMNVPKGKEVPVSRGCVASIKKALLENHNNRAPAHPKP